MTAVFTQFGVNPFQIVSQFALVIASDRRECGNLYVFIYL
jgi:hypothetical protein